METRKKQPELRRKENREEARESFYNLESRYSALLSLQLERKDSREQQREFGLYYQ
jgi:hypothetical protein